MWMMGSIHPMYGEVKACGSDKFGPWRMFVDNGVVTVIPLELLGEEQCNPRNEA